MKRNSLPKDRKLRTLLLYALLNCMFIAFLGAEHHISSFEELLRVVDRVVTADFEPHVITIHGLPAAIRIGEELFPNIYYVVCPDRSIASCVDETEVSLTASRGVHRLAFALAG